MSKVPGIILTSQFTLPTEKTKYGNNNLKFSTYIDYINRAEALKEKPSLTNQEEAEMNNIERTLKNTFSPSNKNDRESEAEKLIELLSNDDFINNQEQFSKYMDYMFRDQALKKKEKLNEREQFERKLIAGKKEEIEKELVFKKNNITKRTEDDLILGAFSIESDKIYERDTKKIRKTIDESQKNNSVHWQDIISFDNNFLEEHGLYRSETGELNEEKLKQASRKMMDQFIKKENLNDPYWFASIHRNTDNIHIHFSTVEKNPSRKIQEYNGQDQPRGKRKQSTIDTMKSSFGNELLDMSEYYKNLSTHRDKSIKFFRETFGMSDTDKKLSSIMEQLDKQLPDEWEKKVQMNHVSYKFLDKEMKKLVDEGVKILQEDNPNLDETIKNYHETLNELNNQMEESFGQKENPSRSLKERREKDFNERLGNAFLKSMGQKKRDTLNRRNEIQNNVDSFYKEDLGNLPEEGNKFRMFIVTPNNNFKKYDAVDKFIWKMNQKDKRRIEEEFEEIAFKQKQQSLSAYEQMMEDVEKAKEQQQGDIQRY